MVPHFYAQEKVKERTTLAKQKARNPLHLSSIALYSDRVQFNLKIDNI